MVDLNSVLVQGKIIAGPIKVGESGCWLRIESIGVEKAPRFEIDCYKKLAENVLRLGQEGRKLRAVGRLEDTDGCIRILAEHVEFIP